jgi:hypothetical protein
MTTTTISPRITIVPTTVSFYIRKGNRYGTRPAWALIVDGVQVERHHRKATLIAVAHAMENAS